MWPALIIGGLALGWASQNQGAADQHYSGLDRINPLSGGFLGRNELFGAIAEPINNIPLMFGNLLGQGTASATTGLFTGFFGGAGQNIFGDMFNFDFANMFGDEWGQGMFDMNMDFESMFNFENLFNFGGQS